MEDLGKNSPRGIKKRVLKINTLLPEGMSNALGKLPPQAVELEEAILGALMLEKDSLTEVIEKLRPDTFYRESHQTIFKAIKSLFENAEPVDILTVTTELRKRGDLELVGGAYYIASLTSKVSSSANIEAHAHIITELAIKRSLISVSSDIQKEAYEDTTDAFELLGKAEQSLFDVSEKNISREVRTMADLLKDALKELDEKSKKTDGLTGVPTGFTNLDRITSGWQPSDLVILAARPGMGKTAFVVSALRNAAVDFHKPVAIFSLEMSAVQLVNRLISAEAEIEGPKLKSGNLDVNEFAQIHQKINKLSQAPIYIDDTAALSVFELRAKCRKLKAKHDIQLIIIDYLQLMSGDSSGNKAMGNREQEIAYISRSLKKIAKELNVPVIALSQLSRAVESRGNDKGGKKPQLSDLRESGSIEQDADMVIFLYRPEYYQIETTEEGLPAKGLAEVIIAKHRNGSLETVPLKFVGKFTKFDNLDSDSFAESSFTDYNPNHFGNDGGASITVSSKLNNMPPMNNNMDEGDPF
jgi:replicative DNA helicase